MTDNSGFVARLRAGSSIHDLVENRTNALVAADLIESLTAERDAARSLLARNQRIAASRAEDDFGDASIQRAMVAAQERGEDIFTTPNPSRLTSKGFSA